MAIIADTSFKYDLNIWFYHNDPTNSVFKGEAYFANFTGQLKLYRRVNNDMYGVGRVYVTKGQFIGILTGVARMYYNSLSVHLRDFLQIELAYSLDPDQKEKYFIQLENIFIKKGTNQSEPLKESVTAFTDLKTTIGKNLLIYQNLLLASRIQASISDYSYKNEIIALNKQLYLRNHHLTSTQFIPARKESRMNTELINYLSYFNTIVNNLVPDGSAYVTDVSSDPYQSNDDAWFNSLVNTIPAITSYLFDMDLAEATKDLAKSSDLLYRIAHVDTTIVAAIRKELKNTMDVYQLNELMGFVPPAIPTYSSVTQPTVVARSGTIVITAQDNCQYSINGNSWQDSNIFKNLDVGNYSLYVRRKDDVDTVMKSTNSVTINEISTKPNIPTAASVIQPTKDVATGTIVIASQDYCQYSIDGSSYQEGNTFGNLPAGNYTLYVRYNNYPESAVQSSTPVVLAVEKSGSSSKTILYILGASALAALKLFGK